jgi:hypothetical protein
VKAELSPSNAASNRLDRQPWELLESSVQRFDEQHMWVSARLIEEIAFLREAEAFVKTLNVGATMAPDFGRQSLCPGMVNEHLKDFPSYTGPAHVFQDGHATNTPTGGQWSIVTRLRHKRADADQLSMQEAPNMQGARRSIARMGAETSRFMGPEDAMTQFVGFCGTNGTSFDGQQE